MYKSIEMIDKTDTSFLYQLTRKALNIYILMRVADCIACSRSEAELSKLVCTDSFELSLCTKYNLTPHCPQHYSRAQKMGDGRWVSPWSCLLVTITSYLCNPKSASYFE